MYSIAMKWRPSMLPDLEGAHDAGVLEHHRELALADEHLDEAALLGELRAHALDGEQVAGTPEAARAR